MKLDISFYKAMPCSTEKFTINGIPASLEDFGQDNSESNGSYGCYMHFDVNFPTEEILKKFNITLAEYKEIKDLIEKQFQGECNWCS